jgi:hypothetical protein
MPQILKVMFDTVAGKFEKGPYFPKDESRNSWETRTREFFDAKLGTHQIATSHVFSRPEARIPIFGDGGILRLEASLPKLLHGSNLVSVCNADLPLQRLHEFAADHVNGEIPELSGMDYLRVDYCHNFPVGTALPDYVSTLSKVSFLKRRRTTDSYGGVEWWSKNGRRIRAYDKFKEILENEKKAIEEARGVLRFEIQLRKKSGFLQRRQKNKKLTLQDVLKPEIAYCCLVETLNAMCLGLGFQCRDVARNLLDERFPFRKATRLLGLLARLETMTMDDLRHANSRSTFYSDKGELRELGLWSPSAGTVSLPALEMPKLENILSAEANSSNLSNTEEANENAITI